MAVLNFSYAKIRDAGLFRDYVQRAAMLMETMGVEVVTRGSFARVLRGGGSNGEVAAVFRYADMAAAERFYSCPEYQLLIPLRDAACDMTIHLYEE
ncbi:DUF1330 domain-containing protein [Leisingera sp. ANG-Vp]|uniref:DUF1330 domain-containing protein n=1 Tax=Leisingera sp. ANG-Vp TaxID=1577896 RepID=UPI00057E4C0C|nr:DUF1330 domain-containing protein [Leisingera sp. ANG-Vp]KIC21568.1 isoleucyl-tRNA synthetase [Leisingera sp. ANG-Vp]